MEWPVAAGHPVAINVPDVSPADDSFTELARDRVAWIGLSGLPGNMIERHMPGLRLSRYRAALQAALAARAGRFVVTHLPRMSAVTAQALRLLRRRVPHLAFSFNFTDLPTGRPRQFLGEALRGVDQFAVFSRFEAALYARHFDLDPARFVPTIWTQAPPVPQAGPGLAPGAPYVCAVGGEGRDFATLLAAARRIGPALRIVVIARRHSLAGLCVPDHVEVLTELPAPRCWRIAMDSMGVLVPLRTRETCCGQVTLVGAKLLGIPIATTRSDATVDYCAGREAVLESEPGDPAAFAGLIERLAADHARLRAAARRAVPAERALHDPAHWADYLRAFVARHVEPAQALPAQPSMSVSP